MNGTNNTFTKFLCKFYVYILLLLLYAPILVLIVFSFTNTRIIGNWDGFSFDLYKSLFKDKEIMQAFGNTFIVAVSSAFVSTVIGTLGAIGIFYSKKRTKAIMEAVGNIPPSRASSTTTFPTAA